MHSKITERSFIKILGLEASLRLPAQNLPGKVRISCIKCSDDSNVWTSVSCGPMSGAGGWASHKRQNHFWQQEAGEKLGPFTQRYHYSKVSEIVLFKSFFQEWS